jgi:preprotein translocase subunit SecG
MKSKQFQLAASLGPETAARFGGGSAGANIGLIQALPNGQKAVARKAFADSLSTMWILYVVFSVVGLAVSLLITRNKLNTQHEETKTGIEAEKAKRLEREAERAERRKKRASKGTLPLDPEAQASDPHVAKDKETTV